MPNRDHPLVLNIPISKIDEEQRKVWGYATVEEVDAHGEVIGYQASKKAFSNWIGNIREMHGEKAVGKGIEVTFDDKKKGVWLGAKISESEDGENAWIKVKEGILAGFSIGGKMKEFEMHKFDGEDRLMITAYDLFEVSLVDNPACPSALLEVVKSHSGKLDRTEKLVTGLGLPVPHWMQRFKFADDQKVMKSQNTTYNSNSMGDITKNIFSAAELVDLGHCLADFIYWQRWSGKDTKKLENALKSIKEAAAVELKEDENFPEPMEEAIELACKTLNISKVEELNKMAEERKKLDKSVVGQEDRDADANVVVPAEENGKGNDTQGEPAETVQTVVEGDPADAVETVPDPQDPLPEDAPAGDADDSDDEDGDAEEDKPTDSGGDDKGGKKKKWPFGKPKDAAASNDISKSTNDNDLAKSILSGVEELIEKSVAPLKEEIDKLKSQPAPSKGKASYATVEKAEEQKDEQAELKDRFDTLNKRADELAADPKKGTQEERIQVGTELRKLSRQMDPGSRAQHAAIRASLQQ